MQGYTGQTLQATLGGYTKHPGDFQLIIVYIVTLGTQGCLPGNNYTPGSHAREIADDVVSWIT